MLDVNGAISNRGGSSEGFLSLSRGGQGGTGYINFMDPDNTRHTYIGFGSTSDFAFATEKSRNQVFLTGNTERMRISSTGNVGIGTTTPGYTLDVSGTINCTGNILRNGSAYTGKIIDITQSVLNYALDYWPGITWTDSPIPPITITPFSSSSRFLLRANIVFGVSPTTTVAFRFVRDGTVIGVGSGGNYQCSFRGQTAYNQWGNTTSGEYMDSPNTTSSITYKIQFMSYDSSRTVRFNDGISGSGADNNIGISTLTITELLS